MRPILGASVFAIAIAFAFAGCSVIVNDDLPDFTCTGSSPSSCPTGFSCDTATSRCVATSSPQSEGGGDDGTDGGPGTDGQTPGDSGKDSGPTLGALGTECQRGADCESTICGTSADLSSTVVPGAGGVCTKTCCTSSDCPDGFTCFSGGTGGTYCISATLANRHPPASGGALAGAVCTQDTDCRSGICDPASPHHCVDTCCRAADCQSSTTCQVVLVGDTNGATHNEWICSRPSAGQGATANGQSCAVPLDCADDNCFNTVCRSPCCAKSACGSPFDHCAYETVQSDRVRGCFGTQGTTADGAACGQDSDCQSGLCDPDTHVCAQICCMDGDCATGHVCLPASNGLLRCVSPR